MNKLRLHVYNDGKVNWVGVGTGGTTVVAHNPREKLIALRVAGHKYWNGIGQPQAYRPTHYQVHRYTEAKESSTAAYMAIEIDNLFGDLEWDARDKIINGGI